MVFAIHAGDALGMATGSSISFRTVSAGLDSLSDAEFLQSLTWTRTAPPELVDAARSGHVNRFVRAWRTRVKELRAGSGTPKSLQALWSLPTVDDPRFEQALAPLRPHKPSTRSRRTAIHPKTTWAERIAPLAQWLGESGHWAEATPALLVCGLELLATSAAALAPDTLWPLFRRVLTAALQHRASVPLIGAPPDVLLQHQGEVPYCAGLLFIDVLGGAESLRRGQKALQKELPARTDNDGTVHAEIAARLPLWLAPLIRCTAWAEAFHAELWNVDDRALLNDVCERTLALCRADGRLALTNGLAVDPLPVLSSAAELFRWSSTNPSLSCLKNLQRHAAGEKSARPLLGGGLVMPSNQSDWARFAVLRSDWSATADTVAVAHHEPLPQLDVTINGQPLIHGPWGMQLRIGETQIELAEEWSCVCWETDPEADYVELQMCGPGKLRVERLILLSRTDQFLFLADSISGVKNERIEYSAELPLVPGLTASTETETRLWQLRSPRSRVRVIPLGLPADRVHSTPHEFNITDRAIQMRHIGAGRGLLAPVVFDWHPKRRTAPVDWKPLTVTEEGKILRPDQAAGYRLRIGAAQWLFYRSLQSTGMSRAVLGHHTFNETVIARFDKQGDTEPLLMIAGPE